MDVQGTEMIGKQLRRSFRKGQEAAPLFAVINPEKTAAAADCI